MLSQVTVSMIEVNNPFDGTGSKTDETGVLLGHFGSNVSPECWVTDKQNMHLA